MPLENSACCYHPDLPKFKEIHGTNTECAEQTFNWLGRHKSVTRMMTQYKFKFYIWNMINGHNSHIYDLAISNVRKQNHNTLNIMHAYMHAFYTVQERTQSHIEPMCLGCIVWLLGFLFHVDPSASLSNPYVDPT